MAKRRKNPESKTLLLILLAGGAAAYFLTRKKDEPSGEGTSLGEPVVGQPDVIVGGQPPVVAQPPVTSPPTQPYLPPPPPPPRRVDATAVARQKALNWLRDKVATLSQRAGTPITLYARLTEDGLFGTKSKEASRIAIMTISSALAEGSRSSNRGLRVATNASFFGDPFRYGAGDRAVRDPLSADGLKALDTLRTISNSEITPLDAYLLHMGGRAALGLPVKQFDIDIFAGA
jgi:hypothetical protein